MLFFARILIRNTLVGIFFGANSGIPPAVGTPAMSVRETRRRVDRTTGGVCPAVHRLRCRTAPPAGRSSRRPPRLTRYRPHSLASLAFNSATMISGSRHTVRPSRSSTSFDASLSVLEAFQVLRTDDEPSAVSGYLRPQPEHPVGRACRDDPRVPAGGIPERSADHCSCCSTVQTTGQPVSVMGRICSPSPVPNGSADSRCWTLILPAVSQSRHPSRRGDGYLETVTADSISRRFGGYEIRGAYLSETEN